MDLTTMSLPHPFLEFFFMLVAITTFIGNESHNITTH